MQVKTNKKKTPKQPDVLCKGKNLVCIFNSSAVPCLKKCGFARAQGWQNSVWETTWDQHIWPIFSVPCHHLPFVAPEQRVLIEMLISGVCCCLHTVMQQFHDSCTGMICLEYLSPARQPISLCCHLIHRIKGITSGKEAEWNLCFWMFIYVFQKGYCSNVAQTLL